MLDAAMALEVEDRLLAEAGCVEIASVHQQLVTFRAAAFGRSTNYTLAYDYSEAPEVLAWVQTQGDITSKLDGRYVFAPNGSGGTEVTYHLEVEMKVPLPGFIKMRAQSRIMSIALRELKDRVESTA